MNKLLDFVVCSLRHRIRFHKPNFHIAPDMMKNGDDLLVLSGEMLGLSPKETISIVMRRKLESQMSDSPKMSTMKSGYLALSDMLCRSFAQK